MNYTVDKRKFLKLLSHSPGLLRKIANPSEDILLDLFKSSTNKLVLTENIYLNLPEELKTLQITRLYLSNSDNKEDVFT